MANETMVGNSLAKSLLKNRKSQENPILQNIKSCLLYTSPSPRD